MDFLQEDVDSMERELETWRSENKELKLKLKHEEKVTEKSIEPLKVHLIELETAVQEQLDKWETFSPFFRELVIQQLLLGFSYFSPYSG